MVKKFSFLLVICLLTLGLERTSYAEYSFRVILKYPFSSLHYDTLGNIVSDSLVRARPIKPIIFRSVAESLYQESVTNDSGYAVFVFDKWQDNTLVLPNNISRLAIDFPCTDKVIEVNGQITFEHLKYSDIDFRRSPGEIEIILPLTVYKDSFAIGNSSWINVCNIAVMNDMHIGEGYNDFGTYGWNDADSGYAPNNKYIINNHNVVAHINQHNPDFVVVLGDVTQSAERSEFQRARSMLGNLNTKPYIPILGNHDAWPYVWTNEASIPSDCFIGEYFYDGFETMFDSVAAIFPNWGKDPYFSSSPNLWSYYLNLSFDFQNWKFVGADFNSRNDAPWPWFGILGEADVNNHTLQWITQNVNVATNE
ncbi:MAG: metallophosphoesterase, partial [candidate division WOR-3 bacterium]